MPVEFKFLDDGIGVLIVGKGHVSGQELINVLDDIYSSEEKVIKLKYTIVDLTSILTMDVSNADIEFMHIKHQKIAKISPDRVVALIANKDLPFGISRMWEAIVSDIPWEINVFRSKNKADAWLKETVKKEFNIDITSNSTRTV